MKTWKVLGAALTAAILVSCSSALGARITRDEPPVQEAHDFLCQDTKARAETTWIFDADFEDFTGDNYGIEDLGAPVDSLTGWYTRDLSGIPWRKNHWHLDTLNSYGDSSMWCGMCNPCWVWYCGYGNDWADYLTLEVDLSACDSARVSFRQIFAMEHDYDYGYLDIRADTAADFINLYRITNYGFTGQPGMGRMNWNSGHPDNYPTVDLTSYVGSPVTLRWRFESDKALSTADFAGMEPWAVYEGAWYIDEVEIFGDGEVVYYENFEDGADSCWDDSDFPGENQTGVAWRRAYNPPTGYGFMCEDPGGWMLVATHPGTDELVDYEVASLTSPKIDISECSSLIYVQDAWFDFPDASNDFWALYVATSNYLGCILDYENHFGGVVIYSWWNGGWQLNQHFSFDEYSGKDYLRFRWNQGWLVDAYPPGNHSTGLYLSRVRMASVSVPSPPTTITLNAFYRLEDTYDPAEAGADSERVRITDADGIASAYVVYSSDGGETWDSNSMHLMGPHSQDYYVGKTGVTEKGTEVIYYFEATDSLGYTTTEPADAPNEYYEYSILPFSRGPGRLVVVSGYDRDVPYSDPPIKSREYYREALNAWGLQEKIDYEVYDIGVPGGSEFNRGPDSLELYETAIWFTGSFKEYCMQESEQAKLIDFLDAGGNLLLSGNDIAEYLIEDEHDTLDFFASYLHASFTPGEGSLIDAQSSDVVDTVVSVLDGPGNYGFIDDGEAILVGGCPQLQSFDTVDTANGSIRAFEYVSNKPGNPRFPAGTQYSGAYKAVYAPFGIEYIRHLDDRVSVIGNVLKFFGYSLSDTATGIDCGADRRAAQSNLHGSYPNPFNPTVTISYSISEPGPVKLQVFNINGQLVRTLVDAHVEPGKHEVVWDGTNSGGREVSSGIYFYAISAPGLSQSRKLVIVQ